MKFCRKVDGDLAQEVEGVKIFFDEATDKLAENYELQFLDGVGGGFFLVKKPDNKLKE
jgi:Fe-S cluster assembly iron-binding protein IscA